MHVHYQHHDILGDEAMTFNQPWRLSPAEVIRNSGDLDPKRRYIFSNYSYSPGNDNWVL